MKKLLLGLLVFSVFMEFVYLAYASEVTHGPHPWTNLNLTLKAGEEKSVNFTAKYEKVTWGFLAPELKYTWKFKNTAGKEIEIPARIPLHFKETVNCPRLKPTIDGNLSEWVSIPPIKLIESKVPISWKHIKQWKGPEDCSAEIRLAYDDNNLYISAKVLDDDIKISKTQDNSNLNQVDSIEFYTDFRPKPERKVSYSEGVFHITVCPADDNGILVFSKQNISSFICKSKVDKFSYLIEAQIPFPSLKNANIVSGSVFGFTFQINDFDTEDGDVLNLVWEGTTFNDVRTDRFAETVFK